MLLIFSAARDVLVTGCAADLKDKAKDFCIHLDKLDVYRDRLELELTYGRRIMTTMK